MRVLVSHKLESWFPNSQKNGLSNSENRKSVALGCVVAELQWLVKTCPINDVLHYVFLSDESLLM